ncbi:2-dehydro-3-deoxygalactonokinase [Consotaella salsifontis]|uniref:2-keto-3-deoxygalactonate kinase n=1 Tax=Consotaella salsifontis TaxID=1365950 RepID=A0A1T4T372_9HYPH|nr:2-dehydro-3-deoxygalactonokinase [Consotaella salsifontis]SKA34608.1 2-keto-3-deoxygalactonate kinase [Consotaella salsifontis]
MEWAQVSGPALIALDWGTSSLRGFLMSAEGEVLAQRQSSHGIQNLPGPGREGFEAAFTDLCGEWLAAHPALPLVAGGMVGSAQGWVEAPYVRCPADVTTLAAHAATVETPQGSVLHIAPGILLDPEDAQPDVIRGEEIQIAGALAEHPEWAEAATVVLPGTHSKWLDVKDGRVTTFFTYMTGEVFAVLAKHSILGRLMPENGEANEEEAKAAFAKGLLAARDSHPGDLTHQLFAVRTLGLTRRLNPVVLKDYLSGLLIGHELTSAAGRTGAGGAGGEGTLLMIGDAALCRRYAEAFDVFGVRCAARLENTAPAGLFRFAGAAGLLPA